MAASASVVTLGAVPSDGGCGTVFKVGAAGAETVLYTFTEAWDGEYPTEEVAPSDSAWQYLRHKQR